MITVHKKEKEDIKWIHTTHDNTDTATVPVSFINNFDNLRDKN